MKNLIKVISLASVAVLMLASCEGPAGPAGKDANESCILCHNSDVVETKAIEFDHSLHFQGTAFEEGTRSACAPCHSHQGFKYVVENNTPATFIIPSGGTKYVNQYDITAANAVLPGAINCFTCHSSLHSTYTDADWFPLTTVAAVPMTMYGGSKTINFAKTSSNLCAKCHQPRPITKSSTSSDGNIIDYGVLVTAGSSNFTQMTPSYRTGVHYGAQGSMAAGVGGIEFGTGYTQSSHVANASCSSCHMATPTGLAGGHSFNAFDEYNAVDNFNGCNVSGCHSGMSKTNATYVSVTSTTAATGIPKKLADLAAKINAIGGGHDILQKDPLDNQYHGYLDIYDASANPTGYWKNPNLGNVAFPTLTNAQFGAIINYQLVFRGGGKGVHNYPYMAKLIDNTMAAW
jgi:hypothetical protein